MKQNGLSNPNLNTDEWEKEQTRLSSLIIERDDLGLGDATESKKSLYVAGVDISYMPGSDKGVAALVVLDFSSLEVVYENYSLMDFTVPYVPGFLGFREVQ
jgi:deoxyinosine 3'endonuclease (endonuclease V)